MPKITIETADGRFLKYSAVSFSVIDNSYGKLSMAADGMKLLQVKRTDTPQIHILIEKFTRDEMEIALDSHSEEGWRLVGPVQVRKTTFEATMVKG